MAEKVKRDKARREQHKKALLAPNGKRNMRNLFILVAVALLCCGCAIVTPNMWTQRGQYRDYAVALPQGWETYLSVGRLAVVREPFYGVRLRNYSLFPQVQIRWSVENLTNEPMYLGVNYGSQYLKGNGGTGMGVGYVLQPNEQRLVHNIVPIWSTKFPVGLKVCLNELRLPNQMLTLSAPHYGLKTGPLTVSRVAVGDFALADESNKHFCVKKAQLVVSKARENTLELSIENRTEKTRRLSVELSVGDPEKSDPDNLDEVPLGRSTGSFAEAEIAVKEQDTVVGKIPYSIPSDAGPQPLLVFRVFEPTEAPAPHDITRLGLTEREIDLLQGSNLVYAGCFDLSKAAGKGEVVLPQYVPVEERSKLTARKSSQHFLFRYRPDSYAAENIDKVIQEREEAYEKLKTMLQMDLPVIVTIDLYPDMEAKGLGSGTKWTFANTVNKKHIAEVYNDTTKCDPNHELAHIFTFHFDGHFDIPGEKVLCEPFAVYCEADTDIAADTEHLKLELHQGKPSHLNEILSHFSPGDENRALIHYLLTRDAAKFRQFYVNATEGAKQEDLDEVSRKIYGTDLAGLERQWHAHLNRADQVSKTR